MKSKYLLSILILAIVLVVSNQQGDHHVRLYPLTNQYFDNIYKISSGNDVLYLHISCKEKNMLSVSITPTINFKQNPRFPIFDQYNTLQSREQIPRMQRSMYTFLSHCPVIVNVMKGQNKGEQFFNVMRDNVVIFTLKSLKLSQGYNIISTEDKSIKWGMGERFQEHFKITDGLWTVWNRDRPWEIDRGKSDQSKQTYGHQPIYLARNLQSKLYHIVYFKNTFGFNLESKANSHELTYHSIGGNIHFIIILGDKDPEPLLKQYHSYVGQIHIPPFWSLGWHQSRWGYRSFNDVQEVVKNYNLNNIPLDTMWSDLDYMDKKAIFTIDQNLYPPSTMKNFYQEQKLHWIPLIDAGVFMYDYQSKKKGEEMDVFLRNKSGGYYIAKVWPGPCHFVDYLHPNASKYWEEQLNRLYSKVPFSGVWLDMNQPSNFQGNSPIIEKYMIQHRENINMMTIDADLPHYNHEDNKLQLSHFEHKQVHAYFGHLTTIPTYNFLKKHGRPFIISRSNSVGSGKYAGHWTGDNNAQWEFLKLSIGGNFLYQIFGIQMVGADICGFHKNTNEQLCARWMQLGSLYPFARNHNQNQSISQQPYLFGDRLKLTSQMVLHDRYSLLKHIYTTILQLNGTGSLFRPLFFEFYNDQKTYEDQISQTQFLIGRSLMSAPIVQKQQQKRQVYFPGSDYWYDITHVNKNPNKINSEKAPFYKGGNTSTITNHLPAPVPLFIRSGHLVFINEPKLRSKQLNNSFMIIGAFNPDDESQLSGSILGIDDYHNEDNIQKCITYGCSINIKITKKLQNIMVLNWKRGTQAKGNVDIIGIRIWSGQRQYQYKLKQNQKGLSLTDSGTQQFVMTVI